MSHQEKEFSGVDTLPITGTFYADKSDPRFELALQTAEGWRNANIPYVVVDGSENNWVANAHRKRGATVLRSAQNGIASQRQQGLRFAVEEGATNVLTHEPEKTTIVDFVKPITDKFEEGVDVLAIGRTPEAEDSLPAVQQRTERLAGWILEETLSLPADALAGPRGFSAKGIKHLIEYPSTQPGMNNWIYMYQTMIEARHAGHSIDGLRVNMIHPETMVEQESGNRGFDQKRYDQFILQLEYLLTHYGHEINPGSEEVASKVLQMIETAKEDATIESFERELSRLEDGLGENGYVIAPRSHALRA